MKRHALPCSVPEIGCLNSAVESPGSQCARAQATCVSSASEGNAARRDESAGEWLDISGTGHQSTYVFTVVVSSAKDALTLFG